MLPISSLALIPIALKTLAMVEKVKFLPFSIREIWARCTPIRLPNSSWVRFFDWRACLMASPIKEEFRSASNWSLLGVPFSLCAYLIFLLLYKISLFPYALFFWIKICFSNIFGFRYFLGWCFLGFLYKSMCCNNKGICSVIFIPKSQQPVFYFVIECSELPYIRIV